MATARVVKPKPVRKPPRKIILELTEGEADYILCMTAVTGGDFRKSPRKYAYRIGNALRNALGYDFMHTDSIQLMVGSPNITFANYPPNKRRRG